MPCQTLIPHLEYADDMCLISDSMNQLDDLDESCNEMSLTISAQKMKSWQLHGEQLQQQAPRQVQLQLAGEPVNVVDEFEYLGGIVMSDCGVDKEINT